MDRLSPIDRSALMSRIGPRHTAPEIRVRKILHNLGLRFRLHRRDLPGTPDIVLPRFRTALFVHGCFWHRHPGCRRASNPATNIERWQAKFERNTTRDREAKAALEASGWRVETIWECELKDNKALAARLSAMFALSRKCRQD